MVVIILENGVLMWKAPPGDQRVDYLHTSYKNI